MAFFKRISFIIVVAFVAAYLSVFLSYIDNLHAKLSQVTHVDVRLGESPYTRLVHLEKLPYLLQNDTSQLRYHRIKFQIPSDAKFDDTKLLTLFSPQIIHGGNFYINGSLFYQLPMSTDEIRRAWYEPMLATIPAQLLNPDRVNTIEIEFSSYQRGFVVPTLMVGDAGVAKKLYEIYKFVSSTLSNATNIFCWVVGLFMVSLWWSSREAKIFGYAGGATILWATLFTLALTSEIPISSWMLWRFTLYISTGGLVLLMSLFLFEYAQTHISKWLKYGMVFFSVGIPFLFLIFRRNVEFILDFYWTGIVIILYVIASANLVRIKIKQRSFDSLTITLLCHSVVATLFAYHDYGVQAGPLLSQHDQWINFGVPAVLLEPMFLTHFTLPLLLIIAGIILLKLHAQQVNFIETANEKLEIELIRKEQELDKLYSEQRIIASENAVAKERTRILQDIHDGLGSRLINILLETRAKTLDVSNLEMDIQGCIEDLRLLVSGQFIEDAAFTDVLDEFCQRIARNLRSAGVQLSYDLDRVEHHEINSQTALNLLRVVQEMVSNTIKHSKAKNCEIRLMRKENSISLLVSDDGIGFDAKVRKGFLKRGMLGIQKRLNSMDCHHELLSGPQGTSIKIQIYI